MRRVSTSITRRRLIAVGIVGVSCALVSACRPVASIAATPTTFEVTHSNDEWRKLLTAEQYAVLRQADPSLIPPALETRQVVVAGVGDGEEWLPPPGRRHHLDLEPLPDGHGDCLAACQVKHVLSDGPPDGMP